MAIRTAKKTSRSTSDQTPWKGKSPVERRKTEREQRCGDDKIGFETVSVKLRPAEKAKFKQVCERVGITPNKGARILFRKASGFLELNAATISDLETVTRQIIGVSRNINQIAKAANITNSPDYGAFMEDRIELAQHLRVLQRKLTQITYMAKRRADGLAALRDDEGDVS